MLKKKSEKKKQNETKQKVSIKVTVIRSYSIHLQRKKHKGRGDE